MLALTFLKIYCQTRFLRKLKKMLSEEEYRIRMIRFIMGSSVIQKYGAEDGKGFFTLSTIEGSMHGLIRIIQDNLSDY